MDDSDERSGDRKARRVDSRDRHPEWRAPKLIAGYLARRQAALRQAPLAGALAAYTASQMGREFGTLRDVNRWSRGRGHPRRPARLLAQPAPAG
jgi:hypothetical protein